MHKNEEGAWSDKMFNFVQNHRDVREKIYANIDIG